jgi:hypothetical protein
MAECQSRGMEGLSGSRPLEELGRSALGPRDPPAAASAIDRITDHRVSHVLQVNPNLVGTPGVQLQPEKIDDVEPGSHKGIGPGRAPPRRHGHALSVLRVPRQRCFDHERTGIQMAPRERRIDSADPAGCNGGPQTAVGKIGLGDDHEA